MKDLRLIVMAGLPCTGKSSVAKGVASRLTLPVLSVDPIEAAMWRAGLDPLKTGIAAYSVAAALAEENLSNGVSVLADAVNPVEEARAIWRSAAERFSADLTFIHCICSDEDLHRSRVESRVRNIKGMPEITWSEVCARRAEFQPLKDEHIELDSAQMTISELIAAALDHINR